jgi:hypothetical protein
MKRTSFLSIGFCMECKSPVLEVEGSFQCHCGAIPKESTYLPATWSIPANNIASLCFEKSTSHAEASHKKTRAVAQAS